jgi:hypothetical protein
MVKLLLSRLCDKTACWFTVWGSARLSNRKVACFVIFGAVSVTLAAYSAFAQRTPRAFLAAQATEFAEPQISNRAAKTNRLLIQTALQAVKDQSVYALASADPNMTLERAPDPVIAATPSIPEPAPAPVIEPKESKSAAVAPAPLPHEKPKRLLPPPPPPAPSAQSGLLDDGQINGLKGRLRLTSDQVEYWPAVEAALRDVVRTQLRGTRHAVAGKVNIDTNAPEVQKLIWAAMPLLMRLREDQKSEVRKLARVIGLEQVASQI